MPRTLLLLFPVMAGFCGLPALLTELSSVDNEMKAPAAATPPGPRYQTRSQDDAESRYDNAAEKLRRQKSADRQKTQQSPDQQRQQSSQAPCVEAQSHETALAAVYQKLLKLRRQHECLIQQNDQRGAKKLALRIQDLERRFRYPVPAPNHQQPVVHAVGAYAQRNVKEPVWVRVTDASGPIVLVLTAYNAVTWNVDAADGVQIDLIICTGYHDQKTGCIPEGIPVFRHSFAKHTGEYAYAYGADRSEWDNLEKFVAKQTGGLPVSTVQGSYYSHDEYVIGPESVDWRIQMLNQHD